MINDKMMIMLRKMRWRMMTLRKMRCRMMMLRMMRSRGRKNDVNEEEDRSQDRDPHFVQACAVEMHVEMSQEQLVAKKCR